VPAEQGHHCPFLNRADGRCGQKHSLDHLDYAYRFCFGRYDACSVYAQLLNERRGRRSAAQAHGNRLVQLTLSRRQTASGNGESLAAA